MGSVSLFVPTSDERARGDAGGDFCNITGVIIFGGRPKPWTCPPLLEKRGSQHVIDSDVQEFMPKSSVSDVLRSWAPTNEFFTHKLAFLDSH